MHIPLADIFPWNDNFNTGLPEIDVQHRRLVEILNNLACYAAEDVEAFDIATVFDELASYAVYHFETEESVWHQYLAEDELTRTHNKTHQSFVESVAEMKAKFNSQGDQRTVIEEILLFLTHWLAFHILNDDKHMAKIVLSLSDGLSLAEAKERATFEMTGAMQILIETVLKMYDSLTTRTLALMREVAERQRAEEKLRLTQEVIDNTQEAIFVTDAECRIIDTNPAFCRKANRDHEALIGLLMVDVLPHLFNQAKKDEILLRVAENGHWSGEVIGRGNEGQTDAMWLTLSVLKNAEGGVTHYAGILSSITSLIEQQYKLADAANHDLLTGLPNRRLLRDRLRQAEFRCNRHGHNVAVCFMDLDGFKQVNDEFGHEAGDGVLCAVAERLQHCLRSEDTVARLGGDEFVLLIEVSNERTEFALLMQRVLDAVAAPIAVKGGEVRVSASIGVTFYPADNASFDQLLLHADSAMYSAKRNGKSQYRCYDAEDITLKAKSYA